MPDRPSKLRGLLARVPPRRLGVMLGAWVLLVAGALGIAVALDEPVGAGARDEAPPAMAAEIAPPGAEDPGADDLPPLALVLDEPPPGGIGDLPPQEQLARLRELAFTRAEPRRIVELAVLYQQLGDQEAARETFQEALRLEPADPAARAGLAMSEAALGGDEEMEAAARELRGLARSRPRSQLIAFNEGWLAVYRSDPEVAERAWRRTVSLGEESRLGRTATSLLEALSRSAGAGLP